MSASEPSSGGTSICASSRLRRRGADRPVDALSEAERAGVIVRDRDFPEAFAFAHDLVRTTLYEDLPVARRMELHRTVGAALEDLFADDLEPHLAEIAYHLSRRRRSGRPRARSSTRSEREIGPRPCWHTRTPRASTSER